MGSSASKKRRNFTALDTIYPESEASSRNSTLVKKKKRKLKKNGDALSVTSLDSKASTVDVSFIPNGKIALDHKDVKDNGSKKGSLRSGKHNAKQGDTDSLKSNSSEPNSVKDQRKTTPTPTPTPTPVDDTNVSRDNSIKAHSRTSSIKSHDLDHNDNKLKTNHGGSNAQMTVTETQESGENEVSTEVTSQPDSGADYNGGGVLPKKGSAQDALSRLMKNGIGTGKKSSLQLLFEASRSDSKKKLSHLCDIELLPSGHVAISTSEAGRSGLQLYSLNDSGRPGATLGGSFLSAPRGICVGGSDCIAVTDWENKTVQFMNMEGEYINSWKTNKFQHPGGIAVNRDGRYVIADIKRKEAAIGLYTPYGKLLRRFGTESFDWPWYVAVDRRNRILVSERKSGINVFDDVGQFLFKFGTVETIGSSKQIRTEELLNNPGGIAVDSQNNILVADTDNYRVALFSPDGLFLKTMLTTRFSRPISVAYDDGHLAVITDADLRVYKTYAEKTSL